MSTSKNKFKRLFFYDAESFTKYWEKQKKKGVLRYTAESLLYYVVGFILIGIVNFNITGRFLGYDKEEGMLVAILMGLVTGAIISLRNWKAYNKRYNDLKNRSNEMK